MSIASSHLRRSDYFRLLVATYILFSTSIATPGAVVAQTEAGAAWLAPTEVDFGRTYPNTPALVTIPITNDTLSPLAITATLPSDCLGYTILEGGDAEVLLSQGQTHYVTVQLLASTTNFYGCTIDLGATVPPISLIGLVDTLRDRVDVSPAILSFPPTVVGEASETNLFLHNASSQSVLLDVEAHLSAPEFSIVSGGGSHSLATGQGLMIRVRFTPTVVGFTSSTIKFNSRLGNRSMFAQGIAEGPRCIIDPGNINFGSMIVGTSSSQTVTLTNTTEDPIFIDPQSTSPEFVFSGSSFTIAPGQFSTFSVSVLTAQPGSRTGALLLGDNQCAPIHINGVVGYDPLDLTASPTTVDIPTIQVGSAVDREVSVTNNGIDDIDLNITLLQPAQGFLIVSGGGLRTLAPGESHVVTLRFVANAPIEYATALSFGEYLVTVPITASAANLVEDCELSTTEAVFGGVTIGESSIKVVVVTNNSGNDLTITPTSNAAELEVDPITATIAPGEMIGVSIEFSPTESGTFNGSVSLGNEACYDIECFGQGIAQEEFDKDLLGIFWDPDFTYNNSYDNPTGTVVTGYLVLSEPSHTGGVSAWEAKITVVGTAVLLSLTLEGDTINLGAGNEYIVGIGTPLPFTSDALLATFDMLNLNGEVTTEIHGTPVETNPSVPDQMSWVAGDSPNDLLPVHTVSGNSLLGSIRPNQDVSPNWYHTTPNSIDIAPVVVGTIVDRTVELTNIGPVPILFDIKMGQPSFGFEIIAGSGLQLIAPNSSREIVLRFSTPLADIYSTFISLGPGLSNVSVHAIGLDPVRDCEIDATAINFGPVNPGATSSRVFDITNTTDSALAINPTISSTFFSIDSDEVVIAAGQTHTFQVLFQPEAETHYTSTIDLGNALCSIVTCVGEGAIGEDFDADLLGIFFDPEYSQTEALSVANQVLTGYLVMTNPSRAGGVLAWECMVETVGNAQILAWRPEGDYINVGTRDDFVVGLASPLPFTDQALLASFDVLNLGENDETLFFLQPARIQSVRNQMSWIAASSPETLLPIHTLNNDNLVASITPTSPVALEVPAPRAQLLGQQVNLSWPAPSESYEGSHVYRRLDGQQAVRLTEAPLSTGGLGLTYTDIPTGMAPGSRLFYSYALIENGVEKARSAEVEVLLPTIPALATRLLPNVPNPFNPMTEINFQLNTTGMASLKIYDVTGRLVRELASGTLSAGPHSRVWQGRDDSGRQAPSGAYYVRLVTREKVDNRKIMLLK